MRRSSISPEQKKEPTFGTYNMKTSDSLFTSVLLYSDDLLEISSDFIQWFQRPNGEQINLNNETNYPTNSLSLSQLKLNNHTINYNKTINNNIIITINWKDILLEHLFALLKRWRTFEGFENNMSIYNDINRSIKEYITHHVAPKYKINDFILYVEYNDFILNGGLRNTFIFDQNLSNKISKFQYIEDNNYIKVSFNQNNDMNRYNVKYYFDITFNKK